jgi:glycosyltransferase involved in cell wall biosynthesis
MLHASPFIPNPGGTEFHVRDLVEALRLKRAVVAYPGERELIAAEVFDGEVGRPIFYRFAVSQTPERVCIDQPEVTALVRRWIDLFSISGVHIQHVIGWPITIGRTLDQLGIPYLYTSHDYYPVCPNWNLFDYRLESSCACTWNDDRDAGCLQAFADIAKWTPTGDLAMVRRIHRAAFDEFFDKASGLVFPSNFALGRVGQTIPLDPRRTQVIEHGCDIRLTSTRVPHGQTLRIGVIGGVAGPVKGDRNYRSLVLRTNHLPVEWYFFGADELPSLTEEMLPSPERVEFRGAYKRKDIADILANAGIDLCVVFPNVDETFSYVLSEAWVAGIPVLVNGRGSLAERVQKHGAGVVVSTIDEAYQWIEKACRDRSELQTLAQRAVEVKLSSNADNALAYLKLYQRLDLLSPKRTNASETGERIRELGARSTDRDPTTPVADVAPEYQGSTWYPKFLGIKRYIPSPVRWVGRKILVSLETTRKLLRPKSSDGVTYQIIDLKFLRKKGRSSIYEPVGTHPSVLFDLKPFRPESVRAVHLHLGRTSRTAKARLLWTHAFDEAFAEAKSSEVNLDGGRGIRDYRFDLTTESVGPFWRAGAEIVKLRLDLSIEGTFEIGPIEFEAS